MSRNPSERSRPDPENDGLTDEEREARDEAREPKTEADRVEAALEHQREEFHAATSGMANRLRTLVDKSGMTSEQKKPFLDLVNELYKSGESSSL